MIRAIKVHPAERWTKLPIDTVVLEFEDRHRRRTMMSGVKGLAFLLDLPDAVMLRGGDALELEDGTIVEVVSAPETLVEIRGRNPQDLVRLAWHIGNRHLPAQLLVHAIRIRQDHVIEEMLRGLGAKIVTIEAPFDPEGGAYASSGHGGHRSDEGSPHAHSDHADHDHGHKHDHDHGHGHDRGGTHHHDH